MFCVQENNEKKEDKNKKKDDKKEEKSEKEATPDLSMQQGILSFHYFCLFYVLVLYVTNLVTIEPVACKIAVHCLMYVYVVTAVAVIGIALIAMGEDIGGEMTFRSFGHLVSQ